MPAALALVTAVSISARVCSFLRRSRIFWLPLSMPNMIVRQPGLRELGEEVLRNRIDAALEPVFDRILCGDEAVADRLDALGLEQEVVVDEVDRAVAILPQLLELRNDVGGGPRPPLALVEDRDVAEHAGPGTAARRLHRGEAIQRQHGRDVERHRLDEVERQALAVGEGPLVEIARQRPVRVVAERAVLLLPGDASHRVGIVQALEQIDDELLAVAPAHEVDFLALRLDQRRVQRREHPAERQLDVGIGRAQLPREDLGVGIARGRQEAHADEVRLLPPQLVDDDGVGRVGIGLIEHRDLVAGALEHRGEGHDADRWKSHDLQTAVRCPRVPWDGVKLRIANVDQEGSHGHWHSTCLGGESRDRLTVGTSRIRPHRLPSAAANWALGCRVPCCARTMIPSCTRCRLEAPG